MLNLAAVRRYQQTRLPLGRYGLMSLLLFAFAWLGSPALPSWALLWRLLACVTALATWRLRDDLFSVYDDAKTHPDRVLVKEGRHALFYALVVAGLLLTTALLWLAHERWGVLAWWCCALGLELGYVLRLALRPLRGLGGELLMLAKYGALSMTIGAGAVSAISVDAWCAALTLWACFVLYELLEDRRFYAWCWRELVLAAALSGPAMLVVSWQLFRGAQGFALSLGLGTWAVIALLLWTRRKTPAAARLSALGFIGGLALCGAMVWPWLW